MAYVKFELVDHQTVIDAHLLGHMQNGIYNAHKGVNAAIKAVLTPIEMELIIANHTEGDIGSFYVYLGETTPSYKKGTVYQLGELGELEDIEEV